MAMDWMIVTSSVNKPIGAIGFVGDTAAVVVCFYDDRDGNMDGRVSMGERIVSTISPISLKGRSIAEVAMQARYDPDIMMRDADFNQMAVNIFQNFAKGLIADGFYAVYFSRGIKAAAGGLAGQITQSAVKQFAIRKGMEAAVKRAYSEATH